MLPREIVFAHWKVEKHLGGGSNGKTAVLVLSHTNSEKIHSALKVVNLITEEGSPEECTPFQLQEYQAAAESCTQAAIGEVLLMSGLQGQPNIVPDRITGGCHVRHRDNQRLSAAMQRH